MSKFVPRTVFPKLDSLPRSYFLGHHRAGLEQMKKKLSTVDMIIECRDFRVPATSINPLFDEILRDKRRLIVYTKRDLGGNFKRANQEKERIIGLWDKGSDVVFTTNQRKHVFEPVIARLKVAQEAGGITGTRAMVVGMPNVGKSTFINTLRSISLMKKKAARTGAQPGITRKMSTAIKIIDGENDKGLYVLDTPGVFVPYMPDADSMLKLALCGCVKDAVIPPTILADYLLFHMNLYKPAIYQKYSEPTNEIIPFLTKVAEKSGKLLPGGILDIEAAAIWVVQRWRNGDFGAFMLDEVHHNTMEERKAQLEMLGGSLSQARKAERQAKKVAVLNRRIDSTSSS